MIKLHATAFLQFSPDVQNGRHEISGNLRCNPQNSLPFIMSVRALLPAVNGAPLDRAHILLYVKKIYQDKNFYSTKTISL